MGNTFAYIMFIIWPVLAVLIYKKFPIISATVYCILGAVLFLPAKFIIDFPLLPPINKELVAIISAIFSLIFIKGVKVNIFTSNPLAKFIIICLLILPTITAFTNLDSVYNGVKWLPPLTIFDAFSSTINMLFLILPFAIGYKLISDNNSFIELSNAIVVLGIFYAILIVYEARMSPQLQSSVYGFFPHSWIQQIRFGGFRPVVFLGHGLIVAIFTAMWLTLIVSKYKYSKQLYQLPTVLWVILFAVLMLLTRSIGAIILGYMSLLVITLFKPKMISITSILLFAIIMLYPSLSLLNIFPHEELTDLAYYISEDRAGSLAFRFFHETTLLNHAYDKMLFGWGGWGRNILPNSVIDGYWIIIFSMMGITGFLLIFGLFGLGIINSFKVIRNISLPQKTSLLLSHYMLLMVILLIDQIPNSSMNVFFWFLSGGLVGWTDKIVKTSKNVNLN
jgi:hypothetical protein